MQSFKSLGQLHLGFSKDFLDDLYIQSFYCFMSQTWSKEREALLASKDGERRAAVAAVQVECHAYPWSIQH